MGVRRSRARHGGLRPRALEYANAVNAPLTTPRGIGGGSYQAEKEEHLVRQWLVWFETLARPRSRTSTVMGCSTPRR